MCTHNSEPGNPRRYPHGYWYEIDYKELDRKDRAEWDRKHNPKPTRWFFQRLAHALHPPTTKALTHVQ